MAKYSKLHSMITRTWARPAGNRLAYLVLGKPGGGKSALAADIVKHCGGTNANTVVFTPSLRDPVDVLGTPRNDGEVTRWVPPAEFYKLRAGVGKCFLIVEELTDASVAMMNAMCRIVLDRAAGDLALSDRLYIIGTGNRTDDRSGANRLTTKLGNRLNVQEFEENLQDWVTWAQDTDIDPILVQFLRFRPNLLSDFDPNRPYGINPTPRSWESVHHCATTAPLDEYFEDIKGLVGEGAASEYAAFRKLFDSLVSFDDVLLSPETTPVPADLSAQFAIIGSLAANVTTANADRVGVYVNRFSADFQVMFWNDATRRAPGVKSTKAFLTWATSALNMVFA